MSISKTRTSLFNGTTLTAGGGNQNSAWIDLTGAYGAQVNIKLTNGGTAPTIAAQVQVQIANDYAAGTPTLPVNFGGPFVAGLDNSGVYYCSLEIPLGAGAVRLVAGSNTAQAVTVDADISDVTAI